MLQACYRMLWVAVADCGRLWQAVAGCGWLWLAVAGCGWLWQVVACCGMLWQVVAGCGRLWEAVTGCGLLWQVFVASCSSPHCYTVGQVISGVCTGEDGRSTLIAGMEMLYEVMHNELCPLSNIHLNYIRLIGRTYINNFQFKKYSWYTRAALRSQLFISLSNSLKVLCSMFV